MLFDLVAIYCVFQKVKGGTSRHCWCVLKEKTLLFYKNETEIVSA